MTPDQYCTQYVRSSGSSFYYSFLILPKAKRRAMMALYAFCREVDDIIDHAADHLDDQIESHQHINRWQQALTLAEQGTLHVPCAHYPSDNLIVLALSEAAKNYQLPYHDLHKILEGMLMDLHFRPYDDWHQLFKYCDLVAGVVGRLSSRIFGYRPDDEEKIMHYATALGRALQLINILRDIHEDAARHRIYIPRCLWSKELDTQYHNQPTEPLKVHITPSLVAAFREQIDQAFVEADEALPKREWNHQRSGIVMGRIYRRLYLHILALYEKKGDTAASLSIRQKVYITLTTLLKRKFLLD